VSGPVVGAQTTSTEMHTAQAPSESTAAMQVLTPADSTQYLTCTTQHLNLVTLTNGLTTPTETPMNSPSPSQL